MRIGAVVFGLLLSAACVAHAADPYWTQVGQTAQVTWDVDLNSMKSPAAGTVAFWARMTVKHERIATAPFAQSVMHARAECDGDSVTISSETYYDKSGDVSGSTTTPRSTPVPPGTPFSTLVSYVCTLTKQNK